MATLNQHQFAEPPEESDDEHLDYSDVLARGFSRMADLQADIRARKAGRHGTPPRPNPPRVK